MAKRRRKGSSGRTKGRVGKGASKKGPKKPAQPNEAAELWDRSGRPSGRQLLERNSDPFLWLTGALYVELGAIPVDQFLSPKKSSDDSEGIPRGVAPMHLRRLHTLMKRYEAASKMYSGQADLATEEEAGKRSQLMKMRSRQLARVLEEVLGFCLVETYSISPEERVIIASDWRVRVTCTDDEDEDEDEEDD